MSKIVLKNLKVAVVKHKSKNSDGYIKQGKIVFGTVILVNGTYKVSIDKDGNDTSNELILDFTPRSFEIVGREIVFSKTKNEYGHYCRFIRDSFKAKFDCGSTERYIPFAPNWIIKGYIVKQGVQLLFDFKQLVGIEGYEISKNVFIE